MIKISITTSKKLINEIKVSGHSDYAPKGKDIVCAGVSAVTIGTLNAVHQLTGKVPVHKIEEDGYVSIKFSKDEKQQMIAQVCVIQLKSIAESYPKYVKIINK
jgi:uncharacterized protein YsxB (DUF464 family)